MLEFSDGFLTHISGDTTELCWCWTITRKDGAVLGFTDHDEDVSLGGVTHLARAALSPLEVDTRLGFSVDHSAVSGILSDASIRETDIEAGLFAGAKVTLSRVQWSFPENFAKIWTGNFGTIKRQGSGFEAELIGQSQQLSRGAGRVFSSYCDARLGDARCGIDLSTLAQGTVCPRTFTACRDTFQNSVNFRGFPYLIGDDAVQAGAYEQSQRSGGSRYTR